MMLDKETYTQEEVEALLEELNKGLGELKEQLEEKDVAIADLEGQVTEFDTLKKDNMETNIRMELTKSGLNENYFDLVVTDNMEDSMSKIEKLVEINKSNLVDNSFRPSEHRTNNEYENAEKQGNTQDMVKSKLSKLFG